MDSKTKRQRYTRQWKYARRSLNERCIGEQPSNNPITFQERNNEENYTDEDIASVSESVEIGVSVESCSSGPDSVADSPTEENCISDTETENEMAPTSLSTFLQQWATKHLIKHNALEDLLRGLKQNGHPELPSTARTLLKTPRHITSVVKSGMECVHFNLRENLLEQLQRYPREITDGATTVELSFNIDGLPLFKSSKTHLWPILCAIHLPPISVFPVTLTLGPTKPTNLDCMEEAIKDIQELLDNGLDGKEIKIRCVVCDAPARAMVKKIKQYSGYYGCDKCTQKGTWVAGRMTYPEVDNLTSRSNDTFRAEMTRRQENEETPVSPFLSLPLDMVEQFPIDYMHQACLGVMKKLLTVWVRGDRKVRMSAGQISNVTQRLLSLQKAIPSCFARKPRHLEDIDRWKATELRQFAVYTGKIVLKGILADQLYDHFMVFSVALSLLLCPTLAVEHNAYSKELMKYFIEKTGELYGEHFTVYNVHSMLHLPEEALAFGSLDACSGFPFENYLGKLKRLVRSGKQPLTQVVKRLVEMPKSPLSVKASKPKFKRPNNAFILHEGKCCEAIEEREESDDSGCQMLLCKLFEKTEALFRDPCDSRILGCFKVQSRHAVMKLIPERQLTRQAIMVEKRDKTIFLAILHEQR
ncbi:Large tegument protein deneddylase [Labeo rohita]|uniref:Large tegument protein deneddylase n=1 Tax=Labeo rohita TaxID=84645 RepID=A0ABQ8L510_LABRO|nr:Large tegument protein deneddylase [Labeo rohita]